MSRDNIIVVLNKINKYYVFYVDSCDCGFYDNLIKPSSKYTFSRGKALIRAHNLQKKLNTEYGVREIDLK